MTHDPQAQDLETSLRAIEQQKLGSYDPRTEHLDAEGRTLFINRLVREDSPYLLQHAHNPVNWYAWGDEAFAAAAAEDKPIFLSIGYSTCHWCHVMEVESFDNVDVARVLNRDFISIKMDREQYPDIDEIYMTGVQLMSGQGGWPMSNFLLPNGQPFFGGTYFPAPNFLHLLEQVTQAWRNKREELQTSAQSISASIARILSAQKQVRALDANASDTLVQGLLQREDRTLGGLAGAPKFPQEPLLLALLSVAARHGSLPALGFVERALNGMACGGIYDQVGGGFHRYSVDAQWLVPHFEKMLYNQSQLGRIYLQATGLTGNRFFERVCTQTLDYVVRDMQAPDGGFYSATDADSEGDEGVFFLWGRDELRTALSGEEFALLDQLYEFSEEGNFEGSNILNLRHPLDVDDPSRWAQLDRILETLRVLREARIHPLRDDKIIVAWTGAMIHTLARASFAFDNAHWLQAAEKAARRLLATNTTGDFELRRILMESQVSIAGQLEDYANLVQGLVSLFDVTGEPAYLQNAASLMQSALRQFLDDEQQVLYLSPEQQTGRQLTRSTNASDGATLSPVATLLEGLLSLSRRAALLDSEQGRHWHALAQSLLGNLAGDVNENLLSHASLLRVQDELVHGSLDAIQYAGSGVCKLSLRRIGSQTQASGGGATTARLQLRLELQPGWHVTSHDEGNDDVVPLTLNLDGCDGWDLEPLTLPESHRRLHNPTGSIPVYEGCVTIELTARQTPGQEGGLSHSLLLGLELQLCNDSECLLPERLQMRG